MIFKLDLELDLDTATPDEINNAIQLVEQELSYLKNVAKQQKLAAHKFQK